MKTQWVIVCGLIFALLTAIAAVINTENVTLNYYWGQVNVSLIVVISASISIGGAVVALFGTIRPYLLRKERDKSLHNNQQLMQENQNLYSKLSELEAACSLLIKQKSQEPDQQNNATIGNQSLIDVGHLNLNTNRVE